MNTGILLLNIGVLGAVLANDLGRRRLTRRRVVRPLIISAVVAVFFFGAGSMTGSALLLEAGAAALGLALGAVAALAMRVEHDGPNVVTVAGWTYAAVWVGLVGARIAFGYAASDLFPQALGRWLFTNNISEAAFVNAFVIFSIALVVARTASIAWRGRSHTNGSLVPAH